MGKNEEPAMQTSRDSKACPLIPVGLDIGSGWTKACGNGRKTKFPSLYSCMHPLGLTTVEQLDGMTGAKKNRLVEAVGTGAISLSQNPKAILVRPVRHGMPYMATGYARLAAEALKRLGIRDGEFGQAAICAGITYDMRAKRKLVKNAIMSGVRPAACSVAPQALGTLIASGRSEGFVINIGHGTTEIISITGGGTVEGTSISKATDFVISQLAPGSDRTAYVNPEGLLKKNPAVTARLVKLLAEHIADEAVRMHMSPSSAHGIILTGGGSQLPGMVGALSSILSQPIGVATDPVMSNAVGFEKKAASLCRSG